MPGPLHGRADAPVGVLVLRTVAFVAAVLTGAWAAALFLQYTAANGLTPLALVSSLFLFLSTCWLAWGASLGLIGLKWLPPVVRRHEGPIKGRTVVLVPICNEDPVVTFARVAAIMQSVGEATDATVHYAILSDTRDPNLARNEELWFARLMADTGGEGRLFYRRRTVNTGRKAGNIEDFFARSGGAYDYALILDADSLMEGATLVEMVRRMEAEPGLGLLQTLPVVVRASSVFGRVMQFAAAFFSPVFSRGLSRLQGNTGPFWGHNALVRVKAFAECCGLPVLSGPPPFGGHILSHDYVEAALLARGVRGPDRPSERGTLAAGSDGDTVDVLWTRRGKAGENAGDHPVDGRWSGRGKPVDGSAGLTRRCEGVLGVRHRALPDNKKPARVSRPAATGPFSDLF